MTSLKLALLNSERFRNQAALETDQPVVSSHEHDYELFGWGPCEAWFVRMIGSFKGQETNGGRIAGEPVRKDLASAL